MLSGRRILLVISGGIAAYKCLDLIRRLRERGAAVRCVLTRAGAQFVTPLSLAALSEDKVYDDLFSLTDEAEIGHIRLSREADLLVVAPASADILARMATGQAGDLASTLLLATDKPVLVAPAMNVRMWDHPATRANMALLAGRGVQSVGPNEGDMACGEYGFGRMAEPEEILAAIAGLLTATASQGGPLRGRRALVTSGPTYEAIDPVRYLANRSSGRQGHAIADALARLGAATILVSGPTRLADPAGVEVVHVESAVDMLEACQAALPVDVAVCAAAVADWRVKDRSDQKIKKDGGPPPALELEPNPDILASLAAPGNRRPRLVVGFAAETRDVLAAAKAKRLRKGCDWIVANDVSPATGTFGGERNRVHLIRESPVETGVGTGVETCVETWPEMAKSEVAERLARHIAEDLAGSAARGREAAS